MNHRHGIALLAGAFTVAAVAAVAMAADAPAPKDGKALFVENKCNTCHTIQAAGVEKKKASSTDTADAKEEKSTKKPPDLSGVGLERKPEWIAGYLMKTESIKGEKHGRKFRGTAEELKVVSTWLSTLNTKKK